MDTIKSSVAWLNGELNWRLILAFAVGMLVQAHFGIL